MSQKTTLYRKFNYIPTPKSARWIKRAMNHRFNILEGVIRSGKDMTASIAFVERIKISKESIFLIGAVNSDKAMRIVGQYILDYCGPSAFKTKYNNAAAIQFTYKGKINYIVFAGGYNKNSQEFIQGDTYGGVYLTEINLLNKDFISQCMKRIAASENPFLFGTLNPKGPKHFFYTDYLFLWDKEQKDKPNKKWLNYSKMYMLDNPIMTDEMREDALAGYDKDSVFYKRDILGMRIDAEGIIYNIRDYNLIDDYNPKDYIEYITVCDQGESISASVFILAGLRFNQTEKRYELDILKRYYYINKDKTNAQVKLYIDTARDYANFVKECIDIMGQFPKTIYIDDSVEFYRNTLLAFREAQIPTVNLRYVIKDRIEDRIKAGLNLLYTGKLRFSKTCPEVIDDFKNAVYDSEKIERTGKFERLKQYTELGHLDGIDCVEYAFTHYKNKLYIK